MNHPPLLTFNYGRDTVNAAPQTDLRVVLQVVEQFYPAKTLPNINVHPEQGNCK